MNGLIGLDVRLGVVGEIDGLRPALGRFDAADHRAALAADRHVRRRSGLDANGLAKGPVQARLFASASRRHSQIIRYGITLLNVNRPSLSVVDFLIQKDRAMHR